MCASLLFVLVTHTVLALEPTSKTTTKTLLFLLLQTDRYAEALDILDNQPRSNDSSKPTSTSEPTSESTQAEGNADVDAEFEFEFEFEKAYSLYRLHRPTEALKLIDPAQGRGTSTGEQEEEKDAEDEGEGEGYEEDEKRKVGHLKGQIVSPVFRFACYFVLCWFGLAGWFWCWFGLDSS
jgi:hypothetical protein